MCDAVKLDICMCHKVEFENPSFYFLVHPVVSLVNLDKIYQFLRLGFLPHRISGCNHIYKSILKTLKAHM